MSEQRRGQAPDAAELDRLLSELATGDISAMEPLYRKTRAAVYGFALSMLGNTQDAQDVLHDCYVAVYAAAGRYRPEGRAMAWLMTITRNLCFQQMRTRRRSEPLPENWQEVQAPGLTPEERLLLQHCMHQLSEGEREVVTLHAVAGLLHREIAQLLGLALPTVLSRYSRAMKKLRAYYAEGGRNETHG